LRPFRRKPKQLDTEPDLLIASSGGGYVLADSRRDRRTAAFGERPGSRGAAGVTDETGDLDSPPPPEVDENARARARLIARTLALASVLGPRKAPRSASGTLVTRRWRGDSDEIDLDRTLEAIAAEPLPTDDDILVRQRVRRRRNIILVVDVSGSARGEQVRTAAATAGAVSGELTRDAVGIVAFWSAAALVSPLGEHIRPDTVVDRLLALPAQGLTNVSFALGVAADELRGTRTADSRVLLLSDCVHNAGPDPRTIAAMLPRLDVLIDVSGEHDLDLGRDLAAVGHGRCLPVTGYRDVAPALHRIFAP